MFLAMDNICLCHNFMNNLMYWCPSDCAPLHIFMQFVYVNFLMDHLFIFKQDCALQEDYFWIIQICTQFYAMNIQVMFSYVQWCLVDPQWCLDHFLVMFIMCLESLAMYGHVSYRCLFRGTISPIISAIVWVQNILYYVNSPCVI